MDEINLKLKNMGCYSLTLKGAFIYTEHGFKIFIPTHIIKKLQWLKDIFVDFVKKNII